MKQHYLLTIETKSANGHVSPDELYAAFTRFVPRANHDFLHNLDVVDVSPFTTVVGLLNVLAKAKGTPSIVRAP